MLVIKRILRALCHSVYLLLEMLLSVAFKFFCGVSCAILFFLGRSFFDPPLVNASGLASELWREHLHETRRRALFQTSAGESLQPRALPPLPPMEELPTSLACPHFRIDVQECVTLHAMPPPSPRCFVCVEPLRVIWSDSVLRNQSLFVNLFVPEVFHLFFSGTSGSRQRKVLACDVGGASHVQFFFDCLNCHVVRLHQFMNPSPMVPMLEYSNFTNFSDSCSSRHDSLALFNSANCCSISPDATGTFQFFQLLVHPSRWSRISQSCESWLSILVPFRAIVFFLFFL